MAAARKGKTPIDIAEANVQQLRNESTLPKMNTSVTIKDLIAYIEAHEKDDYLVKGFESSPKKNPFRKKKFGSCAIF